MLPKRISFKTLLIASVVGDILDLFTLSLPVFDLPITVLHFMYAGPLAIATLTEYIPVIGGLPLYTVAAFLYLVKERMSRPAPPQAPPPIHISHHEP